MPTPAQPAGKAEPDALRGCKWSCTPVYAIPWGSKQRGYSSGGLDPMHLDFSSHMDPMSLLLLKPRAEENGSSFLWPCLGISVPVPAAVFWGWLLWDADVQLEGV